MALKMDRQVDAVDISFYLNEVAERGVIVSVASTFSGSGIAMDSPKSLATVANASSGARPLGLLMNDFVDIDPTRVPLNWFKDQHRLGDKCTILTKGWVVTNKVVGTPKAGQLAGLASSGSLVGLAIGTQESANVPIVGRFRSDVNEDGFAKVYIDL